jgi:hypothetical protein
MFYNEILAQDKTRSTKASGSFGSFHNAAGSFGGSKCLEYILNKSVGNESQLINQISNEVDKAYPLHVAVINNNIQSCKIMLK